MSFGDVVNGLFECGGAFFTWMNAYRLYKDKEIKGVYWPIWAFMSTWGIWNLYYYPSLNQWVSTVGGIVLLMGNLAWTVQAILLMRKK